MSRRSRIILLVAACVAAALLVVAAAGIALLRSSWLKQQVRERTVAAIEHATGARVEIQSFDFDWATLTAIFRHLTAHGTEQPGKTPLLTADSVRIGLRVISLFKHEFEIATLIVDRPYLFLEFRPDGSTNIPGGASKAGAQQTVDDLLKLKIAHFELHNAVIQAGLQRVPMQVRGEDLRLLLAYAAATPHYDIDLTCRNLRLQARDDAPLWGGVSAHARLLRDRLILDRASIESDHSTLQAQGTLQRFADPVLDLQLAASAPLDNVVQMLPVRGLHDGEISVDGTLHSDRSTPLTFRGHASGEHIAFTSPRVRLKDLALHSDVSASTGFIELERLSISGLGGMLEGHAAIKGQALSFGGRLKNLDLERAAASAYARELPWDGIASGDLHGSAMLLRSVDDLELDATITISPAPNRQPLSGQLDAAWSGRTGLLTLHRAQFDLAHSHAALSGVPGEELQVALNSTDLSDLQPALRLPLSLQSASGRLTGTISGPLASPSIAGVLSVAGIQVNGQSWDRVQSKFALSSNALDLSSLSADQGTLHVSASGNIELRRYEYASSNSLSLQTTFRGANVSELASRYLNARLPIIQGIASGSFKIAGTLDRPEGSGRLTIDSLDAYGQRLNRIELAAAASGYELRVTSGRVQAGPAAISFDGTFTHAGSWQAGEVQIRVDSNGFPLESLSPAQRFAPGLDARIEIHGSASAQLGGGRIEPRLANGVITMRDIALRGTRYGNLTVQAATRGEELTATLFGDIQSTPITGQARMQLTGEDLITGNVRFDRMRLAALYTLLNYNSAERLPEGFLHGDLSFSGPLQSPAQMRFDAAIDKLETSVQNLSVQNAEPILISAHNGIAQIEKFDLTAQNTRIGVSGSFQYLPAISLDLAVKGSADLKLFQLFDPNIVSSGTSVVSAKVVGSPGRPAIDGALDVRNGSFLLKNATNGLSNVNGTVRFNQDRATIQQLTAESGGGEIQLTGFVTFGGPGPMVYNLRANAENVRFRYGGSISVTGNSTLQLTGTSENGLLAGNVAVSRAVFNPNTDIGNLLASAAAPKPVPVNQKDLLTGLQLAIHIESAPNLQVSTALSQDVEADIDLRLRGTPSHPILLGTISANQGDVRVFGTKYSINRGDITFLNTVRIEPVLDLDLQTQARGITVDITVSGTPNKLNMNYRSDPPLQPKDIIALLTVGQAPTFTTNAATPQNTGQVSALQAGANTVLGQAISPASNRLSKLFGITNIKIDPLVQGLTNTPQARLTVEQQISRDITVTYITNLAQTSEQIFRFEWAINRQYSLVAVRDDNGEFGIDFQYRKRF